MRTPVVYTASATAANTFMWDNGQSGPTAQYVFPAAGPARVSVTATGVGGLTGSAVLDVTVLSPGTAPC